MKKTGSVVLLAVVLFVMFALGAYSLRDSAMLKVTAAPLDGVPGALFTGYLKDGIPTGTGILELPEGASYIGTFVDGRMNGRGFYKASDGTIHEVFFEDGDLVN
ncbi:MAG: hypothetical protein LBD16_04945 [Oscillospiraceae bacterium]|jgi:hypothetical protein|nr:hypothetical protein [Oscillospiraceae bacterium]